MLVSTHARDRDPGQDGPSAKAAHGMVSLDAALAAAFTWEGLSRHQYEAIHEKDPGLNRVTWIVNWLLFFAAPGWALAILGLARALARA